MTPQEVSERLLQYGVRVINVVESLPKTLVGRRIGDQLTISSNGKWQRANVKCFVRGVRNGFA